jgi:hypothetical protein
MEPSPQPQITLCSFKANGTFPEHLHTYDLSPFLLQILTVIRPSARGVALALNNSSQSSNPAQVQVATEI